MRLKTFRYSEYDGSPQEWSLDGLALDDKNLVVGKNASGKSRILSVITGLARLLSGANPLMMSGTYDCEFLNGDQHYRYEIEMIDLAVVRERLLIDGNIFLDREEGGIGAIIFAGMNNKSFPFQAPTNVLAVVARRDEIQHPFLEPLNKWAKCFRYYQFGSTFGKDSISFHNNDASNIQMANQNPNMGTIPNLNLALGIIQKAKTQFSVIEKQLIEDLAVMKYDVTSIGVGTPLAIRLVNAPSEPICIHIKEKDLPGITDQYGMSTGMFRALALLIHVNDLGLQSPGACVVIDDIGEGLDFDRSCSLIKLLRDKAEKYDFQLIMATNDRFVMNAVPLKEWSLVQRTGNHVNVRNYNNSREIFESFKFTGLSNFSFLELDFINEPPEELE